jgi:anti-sigma regulatory factor (Ser/Thr protein kinase)
VTEREFAPTLAAPGEARHFATDTLTELLGDAVPDALSDDVALVVSELVTNAVRAGSPTIRLDVSVSPEHRVLVRVTDSAEGWPHPRDARIEDPGGRGLALVSAVATSWGARLDESSKTVWAELALPR